LLAREKLYHSILMAALLGFVLAITGCTTKKVTPVAEISLTIIADGAKNVVKVAPGSTVEDALAAGGLTLGQLDRVEPPKFTIVTDGLEIKITRVTEEFDVVEETIPFEQQLQPSEFLSEGDQKTLQMGENGLKEITFRRLLEDGVEVSRNPIKTVIIKEPVPQIILIGVKSSFSPIDIPGRLVYIADGNAWMMEQNTSNRIPVVTTGDLDGRVFELSDNRKWLLFTRKPKTGEDINTLWVVNLKNPDKLLNLGVKNIVHFASWKPGSRTTIGYSTVEPRDTAPGWQANNNLIEGTFGVSGYLSRRETIIETNSGGIYGWWGTDYAYTTQTSDQIAYARPNEIGVVDITDKISRPVKTIVHFQTRGDWAWVPGIAWSPDGQFIFAVDHGTPKGSIKPEESTIFNLVALPVKNGVPVTLKTQVGMFAYPLPSPITSLPNGEKAYTIAFLQAILPNESDISRYRVSIIDRDGSNWHPVFPPNDAQGMEPFKHWGAWSPDTLAASGDYALGVIYQGNLWIVDPANNEAHQITGDGRITRLDWK